MCRWSVQPFPLRAWAAKAKASGNLPCACCLTLPGRRMLRQTRLLFHRAIRWVNESGQRIDCCNSSYPEGFSTSLTLPVPAFSLSPSPNTVHSQPTSPSLLGISPRLPSNDAFQQFVNQKCSHYRVIEIRLLGETSRCPLCTIPPTSRQHPPM